MTGLSVEVGKGCVTVKGVNVNSDIYAGSPKEVLVISASYHEPLLRLSHFVSSILTLLTEWYLTGGS